MCRTHVRQSLCQCFLLRRQLRSGLGNPRAIQGSPSQAGDFPWEPFLLHLQLAVWTPARELHRAPYVYVNSIAMMSAVTRPFGVLLSAFKGGLWWQRSLVPVLQVARFAPVSHICLWLSPLTGNERFILSGLNYIVPPDCWCYFTLNNTTQSSRSAQGQSLRVIDTCKAGEGAAEGGRQPGGGKSR